MKCKLIIDPNTNTIFNTANKKTYEMISGDYLKNCHDKKFYTPCGYCRVMGKRREYSNIYYPLFIRLSFSRLPCVSDEQVSNFPYAIHGYGKNEHRARVKMQNERFSGYITRGCIELKDADLIEVYKMLKIGDYIYIKQYEDDEIKKYMKKYCKSILF